MGRRAGGAKGRVPQGGAAGPGRLRIIGGRWRGRRLPVAAVPGLRPTGDRLRETLFNWLAPDLPGARCLDLFAGTGALGFEALSRGATSCDFVEAHGTALAGLREAVATLDARACTRILPMDALAYLDAPDSAYDLVFLDPPFADDLLDATLARLCERGALAPGGLVYVERAKGTPLTLPADLEGLKEKTTGNVACALYRRP